MAKPKIPDRSDEPALQDSLDHGPQSMTAANSDDVEPNPPPEARDDEGNSIEPPPPPDPAAVDDPAVGSSLAGREIGGDLLKPDADEMKSLRSRARDRTVKWH